MALRRLEVPELRCVVEWDVEDGEVAVAFGGERGVAWGRMTALQNALLAESGAEWVDEELRERIRQEAGRCVLEGESAVYWRATFHPRESASVVPWVIVKASGAEMPPELG